MSPLTYSGSCWKCDEGALECDNSELKSIKLLPPDSIKLKIFTTKVYLRNSMHFRTHLYVISIFVLVRILGVFFLVNRYNIRLRLSV